MRPAVRRWAVVMLAVLAVAAGGCARQVRIESEPSGARVWIEETFVGYTPVVLDLSASTRHVRFEHDGHRPSSGLLVRYYDARSLLGILFPPVWCFPGITTALGERYLIELEPGSQPKDLGRIEVTPFDGAEPQR